MRMSFAAGCTAVNASVSSKTIVVSAQATLSAMSLRASRTFGTTTVGTSASSSYVAAGMLPSSYTGLISWSAGSSVVMSRNVTLSPIDVKRSVMAGVGRPPDHTSPSIEPSFMPSTVLVRSRRCADTSSWDRPAASMSRWAMTSVPDFGEPVEIRLPLKSAIDEMPESVRTMTCV